MSEQNKALCRRVHDEIFAKGNMQVADEIFAADARYHGPDWPEGATGPEVIKQDARTYREAFRIDSLTRDGELAEGDLVAHLWTFTGTHVGDLGGLPPTGRQVTGSGIDVFRVKDGRIAESWQQWDQMGVMQQLGAIPAASAQAT
jgi:predicted SnoaL-like aldol condensation-catalyzing enzyme